MTSTDTDFHVYNQQLIDLIAPVEKQGRLEPGTNVYSATAVSPVCGSRVDMDLITDATGRITSIGCAAEACALTKGVLAIFLKKAPGLTRTEIADAASSFENWLDGKADELPDHWHDLNILAPARSYTARHDSMMLPFRASLKALDKQGQ